MMKKKCRQDTKLIAGLLPPEPFRCKGKATETSTVKGGFFPLRERSRSGSLPEAEGRRREAAACFCG
jgi:hypothetical protein